MTCDDCGDLTDHPRPRPEVSKDWTVCPRCDGLRAAVIWATAPYDVRLQRVLDHAADPKGVVIVRYQDLADALSMIRSLKIAHAEMTEAIRVLTAMAADKEQP